MTYRLNPEVKKIFAPILVKFKDGCPTMSFPDGESLAAAEFNKNYLIDSLSIDNSAVVLCLRENDKVNPMNWVGEEMISFFEKRS